MKKIVKVLIGAIITLFVLLTAIIISYFVIQNNEKQQIISDEIPVGQQYTPKKENIKTDEKTGTKYIDNEIMIMFEGHVSEEQQKVIIEEIGGKLVGNIGSTVKQVEVPSRSLDDLKKLVKELESKDEVFGAMYDRVSNFTSNVTNDPSDKKEYIKRGLKSANWWLNAIQANEAWAYNNRFNNIKIGIVDGGFDTGHEDLKISFTDEVNKAINYKNDHGTHVAGIIGATANNGKGIAGIVWNKELICYDWKPTWLQEKLGGWNTEQLIIIGLYDTVTSGAKVVNFSVGEDTKSKLNTNSDIIKQNDIDDNANLTSKMMAHLLNLKYDFVVVHAAGNGAKDGIGVNAENACFFAGITPENCYINSNVSNDDILNRIIVVANVEETENGYQIYKQSNGGSQVDISAPGQDIYSTITGGFTGSYGYMGGTSMAAPMVTGVASLVWSVNEKFTGPEVKEIVCNNYSEWVPSNPNSPNAKSNKIQIIDGKEIYGYPMVNAKLAVEEAIRRTDNDTMVAVIEEETTENNINIAFQKITDEYSEAINKGYDYVIKNNDKYPNVNNLALFNHKNYPMQFFYCNYDIDNNGTDELLIGYGENKIFDVYGFDGNKAVKLFNDETLAERSELIIFKNGVLKIHGSGGAKYGSEEFYKFSDNGYTLNKIKEYIVDWELYPDTPYYNDNEFLTPKEFENMVKENGDELDITELKTFKLNSLNSENKTDNDELKNNTLTKNKYKVINESMTWHEAKEYCEKLGGHLVTITSKEEQNFINSLLNEDKNLYWIGLVSNNNNWEWITGEDYKYTNWAKDEPNNDFNNTEDVVQIYGKNHNDFYKGEWNDSRSDSGTMKFWKLTNVGFICEFENEIKPNIELTKENLCSAINNYLSENWNGEYSYSVQEFDILEYDDYFNTEIRWNGGGQPNTITGYSCKVDYDGKADIYHFNSENDILESFNVYDYL